MQEILMHILFYTTDSGACRPYTIAIAIARKI